MSETAIQTPQSTMISCFPESVQNDRTPERIQVSCICEDEAAFPPPRPFSFQRNGQPIGADDTLPVRRNIAKQADDFLDRTARSVRRVGYALILASVLLLVLDGVFRNTLGF